MREYPGSLIISPHVDDEVLGCGGILGKDCLVYYCGIDETRWNEKNRLTDPDHRIPTDLRFKEIERVAKLLGFTFECNFDSSVNMLQNRNLYPNSKT